MLLRLRTNLLLATTLAAGLLPLCVTPALADIPKVALSEQHRAMCKVGVGDTLPEMTLTTPNGDTQPLAPLLGKQATVVVFYQGDGWMTRTLLADLGPDVTQVFGKQGVAVIAIRVNDGAEPNEDYLSLADPNGEALATVGQGKLPRVYVVDPKGKILWFDIEYSMSTRRELKATLTTVVGE